MSNFLRLHRLYSPWNSSGRNTEVGSHSLFQGIFPTQGSNQGLLHFRQILHCLSHQGSLCYIAGSHWLSILHMVVCVYQHYAPNSSHHHLPPLGPHVCFSMCASLFLPWKWVHLDHFSRFHIYVLIYNTCFALSDLLYCVWQTLGPSTCLQITLSLSFQWLTNTPLYVYTFY